MISSIQSFKINQAAQVLAPSNKKTESRNDMTNLLNEDAMSEEY